jgi:hypothetical protein
MNLQVVFSQIKLCMCATRTVKQQCYIHQLLKLLIVVNTDFLIEQYILNTPTYKKSMAVCDPTKRNLYCFVPTGNTHSEIVQRK